MMRLTLKQLNKMYGENHALKDFSYEFTEGVYGLLGPNGAGKSTLMNIITDNIKESSGEVLFDGINIKSLGKEFRRILGFMPQQQSLYGNYTLIRFMFYMAALKGLGRREAREQIDRLLKLVNLADVRNKRLGSFSGGMKQRVLIAQAMLGDPKVIILDEPTAGLDPKERIRIRNIVSEIAFQKIVIIATHVVSDIEFIAKEVLLIKKGQIVAAGSPYHLCDQISEKVFEIKTTREELANIGKTYKIGNISRDEDNIYVRITSDKSPGDFSCQKVKPTLEDLYLHYFDEVVAI